MANGQFVEDLVLNPTKHPDAPDSIKVRNTVLEDSRINKCIMALDTAIDTVGLPTVEEMLTAISNTEDSINTMYVSKADANHTHTHAELAQNQDSRHVPEGGVNGDVLVFDAAEPTLSKWSTVPAAPTAPVVETLQLEVIDVTVRSSEFTREIGKHYVFNTSFTPDGNPGSIITCLLDAAVIEEADIGSYVYFTVENLPPNCPFVIRSSIGQYTGTGVGGGLAVRTLFGRGGNAEILHKLTSGVIGLRLANITLDTPATTGRSDARVLWFDVVEGDVSSQYAQVSNAGVNLLSTYPHLTDGIVTLIHPEVANGSFVEQLECTSFSSFLNALHDSPSLIPSNNVYMSDGTGSFYFKEVYSPENPPPSTPSTPSGTFTYLIGTPPTITANVWCFYDIIAAGAPISITLPNSLARDDLIKFRFTGLSSTVTATFLRNGLNIEAIADNGVVSGNGTITIRYAGVVEGRNLGWVHDSGILV